MRSAFIAILVFALGCEGETARVVVNVRTDLVPGAEFTGVLVRAGGVERQLVARREQDFITGLQVAEIEGLAVDPSARIDIELVTPEGVVVTRPLVVDLSPLNVAVTVVITRDCQGVMCPGAGDATATACLAGMCVDPRCSAESPELCSLLTQCVRDAECPAMNMCSVPVCEMGLCLYDEDESVCGAGTFCVPETGCQPLPAFPDAGPPDAGDGDAGSTDAGAVDAGADAGAPRCSLPPGDPTPFPGVCEPTQPEMIVEAVIVAEAGGCEVRGRFLVAPEADGFVPFTHLATAGFFDLQADGSFSFIPGAAPFGAQFPVTVDLPGGGLTPGCVTVEVVDTTGFDVLRGPDWDDPLMWEADRLPSTAARVFVAEGAHVATDISVAELHISSGATLTASGTARSDVLVGNLDGDLSMDSGAGMMAGRANDLLMGDGAYMVFGSMHVTGDAMSVGDTGVALDLMIGRLTVDRSMTFAGGPTFMFGLQMLTPGSTLAVTGDIRLEDVVGGVPVGFIWARGDVVLDFVDMPGPALQLIAANTGSVSVDVNSIGGLALGMGAEATFVLPTLVQATLSSARPMTAAGGPVNAGEMALAAGFSSSTPSSFICPACRDDAGGALCTTLPMCGM